MARSQEWKRSVPGHWYNCFWQDEDDDGTQENGYLFLALCILSTIEIAGRPL